jgi:hypothetical protein
MQLYLGNCLYGLPFKQYNERVLWGKTLAKVVKRLDFVLSEQPTCSITQNLKGMRQMQLVGSSLVLETTFFNHTKIWF